jgi:hypothetical protein
MRRSVRYVPVLLAAAVAATVGARAALSSQTAVSQTMHAYVHEDASIGLTFDDGSSVGSQAANPPTIPPGTYTIRVVDDAVTHNFHLSGPGVDVSTTIGDMSTPTWTVTFQPGQQYRFQCDDHPDFMYGGFQTSGGSSGGSSSGGTSSGGSSSGGTSSGGTSSSGSGAALLGTLVGRVNPAGKLALTYGGIPVTKIKAGRYKFTVADKSPKRSFMVKKTGGATTTVSSVAFVGTHSVTVSLGKGKYTFFTSAGPKSVSSFTVS